VVQKREHKVEGTITLQLMKREKNSTYAVPIQHWEDRQGRPQSVDGEYRVCLMLYPGLKPVPVKFRLRE
jgi:hypothetical protein